MLALKCLLLLVALAGSEAVAATTDEDQVDCTGFPFFANDSLSDFAHATTFSTVVERENRDRIFAFANSLPRYEHRYYLTVSMKSNSTLSDLVDDERAQRCLQKAAKMRESPSWWAPATPDEFELQVGSDVVGWTRLNCKLDNSKSLYASKIPEICKASGYYFKSIELHECGTYNLTISVKSFGHTQPMPIGSVMLDLPHFTLPHEVEHGFTWSRLRFNVRDNAGLVGCFPNRTYTVKCGGKTFTNVTESDEITVDKLLPSQSPGSNRGECSFQVDGGQHAGEVALHTRHIADDVAFLAHDRGVFLASNDVIDELVQDTNLIVRVVAAKRKWSSSDLPEEESHWTEAPPANVSISATAIEAIESGVVGLDPGSFHKVCLTLSQREGQCTFECDELAVCKAVWTLPAVSSHESITALWAIVGVMILFGLIVVLAVFVVWLKLSALGAPSAGMAWMRMKSTKRCNNNNMDDSMTDA